MARPFKKRKFNDAALSNYALTNRVKTLTRRVAQNKPETQYTRASSTITPVGTGPEVFTTDISALFSASSTKFQGQKFRNLWIKGRVDTIINANRTRVVIYRPRKPSESFTPTSEHFTSMPDPEKYVVYYDRAIHPASEDHAGRFMDFKINLKGLITSYDNTSTTLQEGQLRMTFITQGSNSSAAVIGWLFAFQDV